MRLDKFLKVSRIIKRRTIANEVCAKGRVKVNGVTAKAGKQVAPGDILDIQLGEKPLNIKILKISETTRREDTESMYRVVERS